MKQETTLEPDDRLLAWKPLTALLVFFAACAWVSTPILLLRSVMAVGGNAELIIGVAALAGMYGFSLLLRARLPALIRALRTLDRHHLVTALVAGVILRVLWILLFRPAPSSDGLAYLQLAHQIVAGGGLQKPGALAFWPPGYPIFLTPFVYLLPAAVAVPLSQITLFVVGAIGVHRLTRQLGSPAAATLAVFLFAIWPNLVALCATPEKEMLASVLLIWSVRAFLSVNATNIFLAGLLLGCTALVQPSMQLLIPAVMAFLLVRLGRDRWYFLPVLLLGATVALAPWTARNYVVLGAFKLISTNGGDVLYRANNPLATGAYTETADVDLSALSELDRDKAAKALAVAWIRDHPMRFAGLIVEKQVLFMGDDAYGVYSTFRSEGKRRNSGIYVGLKLLANVWWLVVWLSVATLISHGAHMGRAAFLTWGWAYLFCLHSVFESSGKYHVPMLWILCISLALLVTNIAPRRPSMNGNLDRFPVHETSATQAAGGRNDI
jgi:hypothetical protein